GGRRGGEVGGRADLEPGRHGGRFLGCATRGSQSRSGDAVHRLCQPVPSPGNVCDTTTSWPGQPARVWPYRVGGGPSPEHPSAEPRPPGLSRPSLVGRTRRGGHAALRPVGAGLREGGIGGRGSLPISADGAGTSKSTFPTDAPGLVAGVI